MDPLTIRKEIEIEAPAARVWPYVATQEGCRRWFCTVAEVYHLILEPTAGGRYEDHMVVNGKTYRAEGEILTYEPPRRLVYRYRSRLADGSLTPPNTVTITLIERNGRTRVILEETGFDQHPEADRQRRFASIDQGWGAALEDLRAILVQELLPALGMVAIYKSIEVDAPIERVWWFVGTQDGNRARHRAESVPGTREYRHEVLEEREGGAYKLSGIYEGQPFRITGRVLTCEPPRLLVMTWREDGWPADTLVTFRLVSYFGRTRVTVLHSGFERLPAEWRERALREYEAGRQQGLEVLRHLLNRQGAEVQ